MSQIVSKEHKKMAGRLKTVLATYNEAEDLINIGAYRKGTNKNIDYAVYKINKVNKFLCQDTDEKFSFEEELEMLKEIFDDYEDFENGTLNLNGIRPK
jgi:flagellum-specific ATP synthase